MRADKDPVLEQKFFNLLFPLAFPEHANDQAVRSFATELAFTHAALAKDRLLEIAISVSKNLPRHDTEGQDFIDGSDAKTASVRWANRRAYYGACISSVSAKRGLLRCVVYERMLDRFYYFLIPHEAYQHIPKSSNIEIPFDVNTHEPRRNRPCRTVNFWDFEVADFQGILGDTTVPVKFADSYLKRLQAAPGHPAVNTDKQDQHLPA